MQVGIKTIFDIDEETFEKQDDDNRKQERINEEKEKLISLEIENAKKISTKNMVLTYLSGGIGAISLLAIYPKAIEMNDYALATIGGSIGVICCLGCGYYVSQYEKETEKLEDLEKMLSANCKEIKDNKKPRRLTKK